MLGAQTGKSSLAKEDTLTSDFIGKLIFKKYFFKSFTQNINFYLATVIELRGECEPFQFTLDPPAIFVPGSTYMHSTTRKAFRVRSFYLFCVFSLTSLSFLFTLS